MRAFTGEIVVQMYVDQTNEIALARTHLPFVVFIYFLIYLCNEHINYETYVPCSRSGVACTYLCFYCFYRPNIAYTGHFHMVHSCLSVMYKFNKRRKKRRITKHETVKGKTKFTFVSFFFLRSRKFIFARNHYTNIVQFIFSVSAMQRKSIFFPYSLVTLSLSFCFVFSGNFSTQCLLYSSE